MHAVERAGEGDRRSHRPPASIRHDLTVGNAPKLNLASGVTFNPVNLSLDYQASISVTATDICGNSSTDTFKVNVK